MITKLLLVGFSSAEGPPVSKLRIGSQYKCDSALCIRTARAKLKGIQPKSIVISKYKLQDGTVLQLMETMRKMHVMVPVIVISDQPNHVECRVVYENGAIGYIDERHLGDDLLPAIQRAEETCLSVFDWEKPIPERISKQFKPIQDRIEQLAPSDFNIFLSGEIGVGKEIVAREIHYKSNRRNNPFVLLDCAALPHIELKVIDPKKQSVSNALTIWIDTLNKVKGGTLFLRGIQNLPLEFQSVLVQLLRSPESCCSSEVAILAKKLCIISSCPEPVSELTKREKVRPELISLLSEGVIEIPPLRDCPEDLVLIIDFFLKKYAEEYAMPIKGFSSRAYKLVLRQMWIRNITEVRNVIRMAVLAAVGEYITVEDLVFYESEDNPDELALRSDAEDRKKILRVLNMTHWNQKEAARLLRISVKTLSKKMVELDISR